MSLAKLQRTAAREAAAPAEESAVPQATADGTAAARVLLISERAALLLLAGVALAALVIQGGLFFQKTWLWTGDTIYHHAVMAEIQAGELLPGGPYAGLPAFYSPLLHYMAAALGLALAIELTEAIRILSILFAPLTPVAVYWLARVLGMGRAAALLGSLFATFGGGLKLEPGRVWVDALFTGQHNFFPLFPRDIAFLLLPIGFGLLYRALAHGWKPGAVLAGLAFGLMVLAHTQTAIFAASVLFLYLPLAVLLRPDLLVRAARVSLITSAVTLAVSSFWWVWQVWALVQSRSFSVEMPPQRVPVNLTLAELPLELGVFFILGPLGLLLVGRRLFRARDLGVLLLLVWCCLPVLLAVFRPTGFPGGDTFFPRRLWQFASQPLVIMAGAGMVHGVLEPLVSLATRRGWHLFSRSGNRTTFAAVVLLGLAALAVIPGSVGTWQRIAEFWNEPAFADQEWHLDQNFAIGPWLAADARSHGPRTVVAPTPEATLVWYYAGQKVVYLHRTAAIKLAYDVARTTGYSEAERQADLVAAYGGAPGELSRVADKYDAATVLLKSQGDRLAAVDLPARAFHSEGRGRVVETNHYEYLQLNSGDRANLQFWSPVARTATIVLRAKRRGRAPATLGTLLVNDTPVRIADSELPRDAWADVRRDVPIKAGLNQVALEGAAALEVIRFAAYTLTRDDLPPAWELAYGDDWYVILRRPTTDDR